MTRKVRPMADRFWALVDIKGPNDCWNWLGTVASNGYGHFGLGRRSEGRDRAHRVAFRLNGGATPKGMDVCHRCDNRKCVNPAHLFVGTRAENLADMTRKGRRRWRHNRGSAHHNAKLTEQQVEEIIRSQSGADELARRFSVSRSLIFQIKRGDAWRHMHSDR